MMHHQNVINTVTKTLNDLKKLYEIKYTQFQNEKQDQILLEYFKQEIKNYPPLSSLDYIQTPMDKAAFLATFFRIQARHHPYFPSYESKVLAQKAAKQSYLHWVELLDVLDEQKKQELVENEKEKFFDFQKIPEESASIVGEYFINFFNNREHWDELQLPDLDSISSSGYPSFMNYFYFNQYAEFVTNTIKQNITLTKYDIEKEFSLSPTVEKEIVVALFLMAHGKIDIREESVSPTIIIETEEEIEPNAIEEDIVQAYDLWQQDQQDEGKFISTAVSTNTWLDKISEEEKTKYTEEAKELSQQIQKRATELKNIQQKLHPTMTVLPEIINYQAKTELMKQRSNKKKKKIPKITSLYIIYGLSLIFSSISIIINVLKIKLKLPILPVIHMVLMVIIVIVTYVLVLSVVDYKSIHWISILFNCGCIIYFIYNLIITKFKYKPHILFNVIYTAMGLILLILSVIFK